MPSVAPFPSSSCPARAAARGARFQQPMCQEGTRNRPRARTSEAASTVKSLPPAASRAVVRDRESAVACWPGEAPTTDHGCVPTEGETAAECATAETMVSRSGLEGERAAMRTTRKARGRWVFRPISPRRRATMGSASPNPRPAFVPSGTIRTPLHRHHPPTVATWDIASTMPRAVRHSTKNSGWSSGRTARSCDLEPEAWHLPADTRARRVFQ